LKLYNTEDDHTKRPRRASCLRQLYEARSNIELLHDLRSIGINTCSGKLSGNCHPKGLAPGTAECIARELGFFLSTVPAPSCAIANLAILRGLMKIGAGWKSSALKTHSGLRRAAATGPPLWRRLDYELNINPEYQRKAFGTARIAWG